MGLAVRDPAMTPALGRRLHVTPTTRNPQDATRRNVQAVNKRLVALERRVATLERALRSRRA